MYILITPAKNEENNLTDVAYSIINQTIKPMLWLIVDDGSTDSTPLIIKDLTDRYDWIKTIKLSSRPRDITFHIAYVYKSGFDYVIEYCKENNINYEFIGTVDADTVLNEKYFEGLLNEFEKDKRLGIASGGIYYNVNEKLKLLKTTYNLPLGTGRLWKKDCFFDTDGYLVEPSSDSISNVKAMLHGWETRVFKNNIMIQKRRTSSAEGLWKGYRINGKMAYYLNKHPLLILINVTYFTMQKPYYIGVSYLYGYLLSLFKQEKQINDKEIRNYFWNTRIKEVLHNYLTI